MQPGIDTWACADDAAASCRTSGTREPHNIVKKASSMLLAHHNLQLEGPLSNFTKLSSGVEIMHVATRITLYGAGADTTTTTKKVNVESYA